MIVPCEVAVKSVIPAMKALMAKELVERHGLKQGQAAKLLGISQSSVSKYARKVRGCAVKLDDVDGVKVRIETMISLITSEDSGRTEFLRLFCQACMAIRKEAVMCECCRKADPDLAVEECNVCLGNKPT